MTRLNLGCGGKVLPGYENIDLFVHAPGVVCLDIRALPHTACSVDSILAEDILEHFPRLEWPAVLAEWVRVLKPGGTITLQFPEMTQLAEKLLAARTNEEWDTWNRRIFGGQGDGRGDGKGMYHYTGFSHEYLRAHCEKVLHLTYVTHSHHNYNATLVMRK